jgi:hypothetical protein
MKSGAMVDRDGKWRDKVDNERERERESPFNNRHVRDIRNFLVFSSLLPWLSTLLTLIF